jgi:hypothetical protein
MASEIRFNVTPGEVFSQIAQIAFEPASGFTELVEIAGLDPAKAFRVAIPRGDMSGQDLTGYDFTGATFASTCDLRGANLLLTLGVTDAMLAAATTDTCVPPAAASTTWPTATNSLAFAAPAFTAIAKRSAGRGEASKGSGATRR